MSTYDKIAWLPLCGGLTGLGLVLSYFAMRRRGMGTGLRWAAWSLLPMAAYLTGSIEMFWKMGVADRGLRQGLRLLAPGVVGDRAGRAGRGAVHRVRPAAAARGEAGPGQAGRRARVRHGRGSDGQLADRGRTAGHPPGQPSARQAPAKARKGKNADDDDDLGDVADILRRHGIT